MISMKTLLETLKTINQNLYTDQNEWIGLVNYFEQYERKGKINDLVGSKAYLEKTSKLSIIILKGLFEIFKKIILDSCKIPSQYSWFVNNIYYLKALFLKFEKIGL